MKDIYEKPKSKIIFMGEASLEHLHPNTENKANISTLSPIQNYTGYWENSSKEPWAKWANTFLSKILHALVQWIIKYDFQ